MKVRLVLAGMLIISCSAVQGETNGNRTFRGEAIMLLTSNAEEALHNFFVLQSYPAGTEGLDRDTTRSKAAGRDGSAPARLTVQASRADVEVKMDGVLDEPSWAVAQVITELKQRDPVEGAVPTERTEIRILFDNDALYIGAHLYDSSPDSILARLGRRDAELNSDRFWVYIDPYLDRRTGFYFAVTAAGALSDGILYNDDWNDDSWDGVWHSKTRLTDFGWTAEIRIPYSLLRFYRRDTYVWGINFRRDIARKHESDYLVFTPKNESGFVSRFVDLMGINQIAPSRQIELVPYLTTRAAFSHPDAADPFNDGSQYTPDLGADLMVGITSNLTLNATVNPDFGQVEVDPAVVNLSDFETFYPEKRPFFIEGSSLFNFGYGGSNSNWGFNWGNPDFFYSRRIGRPPQGMLPDHDYNDVPEGTRIIGAAKITGKIGGNLNVGVLQAVTARESAAFRAEDTNFWSEIEPATYYGVARAQQEWNEGFRALGFIATVTQRRFNEPQLRDQLNSGSYAFGIDGWTFLDENKTWVITSWFGLSQVRGTRERMIALQQSSLHYFQRPDARYIELDSTATSLTGTAGRIMLNKQRGNFFLNSALGFISPSFDVNDLGFQGRTDVINAHFGAGYSWTEPGRFSRNARILGALFGSEDFDGNTIWMGTGTIMNVTFLNYYSAYLNLWYNPQTINNRLTRGGPLAINKPGFEVDYGFSSDSRKPWVIGLNGFTYQRRSTRSYISQVGLEIEWKPASSVSVELSPQIEFNEDDAQYVDVFDDPLAAATFGRRYVFADLRQVTVSSSLRLNWTFTPQLTFQLYAQPLISSGEYTNYKELSRPKSRDFLIYGQNGSTFSPETRLADPDGTGPAPAIELPENDFNFKSLRGNAVLRWEYRPGSVLYLVWTQRRALDDEFGDFRFGDSVSRLFDAKADNVFMIKLTYWLSR